MWCGFRSDGVFAVIVGEEDVFAVDDEGNCGCGDHFDIWGRWLFVFLQDHSSFFFSGGGHPLFYLKETETPLPTLVTVEATPCHFFSVWFAFGIEARR